MLLDFLHSMPYNHRFIYELLDQCVVCGSGCENRYDIAEKLIQYIANIELI